MKTKTIITVALIAFVAASVGYLIAQEFRPASEKPVETETAAPPVDPEPAGGGAEHTVLAYYFHGNVRCTTCRTIEAYAHEALHAGFPDALNTGALEWRVVNLDEPANEHFVEDYELATRSVVLVDLVDGQPRRWKNLDQVWRLVRDKPAFLTYVRAEAGAFLKGE